MSLTWLHISDFHLKAGDRYDQDVVLRALVGHVRKRCAEGRPLDVIFATGDIGFSGQRDQYLVASRLFDDLLGAAQLGKDRLVVIPGNHDVDRDQGIGLERALGDPEQITAYFAPQRPKPHLTMKMAAYLDWYGNYFADVSDPPSASTCSPVRTLTIGGHTLAILTINTAIFCQDDNDHNKLLVGRRALDEPAEQLAGSGADLRIALMHHPLSWLSDLERSNITATLAASADFLLRGHLHETAVEIVGRPSGTMLELAAGAAYQTRRWPNCAMYGEFDGSTVRVTPIRYEDTPTEVWTTDPSIFPDERDHTRVYALPRTSGTGRPPPAEATPARVPPSFRTNVPSRGSRPLVGREDDIAVIAKLLADLSQERVVVLHGAPGVGKSELAREYARRSRTRYPGGTFFVNCSGSAASLELARIGANHLGLQFPAETPLDDQAERTLVALAVQPTLLIYDNPDSAKDLAALLPRSGTPQHVLVTTWNKALLGDWPEHFVKPLSPAASLELVEKVAGPAAAAQHGARLVSMSEGLPIQLLPASQVLAYEARRGRLDTWVGAVGEEVSTSFELVMSRLDDNVRLLLRSAALLQSQHIVISELRDALVTGAGWTASEFQRCVDICVDFHLLEDDTQ